MKTVLSIMIVAAIAIGIPASVEAGSLKRWAKREAKLVHRHGAGHYQAMHPKARFVGTGTGNQTCRTSGRVKMTVRYRGSTVRVW